MSSEEEDYDFEYEDDDYSEELEESEESEELEELKRLEREGQIEDYKRWHEKRYQPTRRDLSQAQLTRHKSWVRTNLKDRLRTDLSERIPSRILHEKVRKMFQVERDESGKEALVYCTPCSNLSPEEQRNIPLDRMIRLIVRDRVGLRHCVCYDVIKLYEVLYYEPPHPVTKEKMKRDPIYRSYEYDNIQMERILKKYDRLTGGVGTYDIDDEIDWTRALYEPVESLVRGLEYNGWNPGFPPSVLENNLTARRLRLEDLPRINNPTILNDGIFYYDEYDRQVFIPY